MVALLSGCSEESFPSTSGRPPEPPPTTSSSGSGGSSSSSGTPPVLELVEVVDLGGQAIARVDVIVNDKDGALLEHTTTDADGRARVDVPPDGSVSVLHKYSEIYNGQVSTRRSIRTAVGLEEGGTDRVTLATGPSVSLPANEAMGPMTLILGPAPAGTVSFHASLTCGGGHNFADGTHVVTDYTGCPGANTYDVFVLAMDGDGLPIGYGARLDQPFLPGVAVTHVFDVSSDDFVETSMTVSPIPTGSLRADMALQGYRAERPYYYGLSMQYVNGAPGVEETRTLRLPSGLFSKFSLSESVSLEDWPLYRFVGRWRSMTALPSTSLWGPTSMATVESVDGADLSDVARPLLRWSLAASGSLGDYVEVWQEWFPGQNGSTGWLVTQAPTRAGSARFPELPSALAEYHLNVGDVFGTTTVVHRDDTGVNGVADYLDGYEAGDEMTMARASRSPD